MQIKPDEVVRGDLEVIGPDGKPYIVLTGANEYHFYNVDVPAQEKYIV